MVEKILTKKETNIEKMKRSSDDMSDDELISKAEETIKQAKKMFFLF